MVHISKSQHSGRLIQEDSKFKYNLSGKKTVSQNRNEVRDLAQCNGLGGQCIVLPKKKKKRITDNIRPSHFAE